MVRVSGRGRAGAPWECGGALGRASQVSDVGGCAVSCSLQLPGRLAGGALSPWGPGSTLGRWPWVLPSLALASCCLLPLDSWFQPPHGAFVLLPNSGSAVSTPKWWGSKPPLLSTWVGRKESPRQDTRSPGTQKFLEAVFLFLILELGAQKFRELGPGRTTGVPCGGLGLLQAKGRSCPLTWLVPGSGWIWPPLALAALGSAFSDSRVLLPLWPLGSDRGYPENSKPEEN